MQEKEWYSSKPMPTDQLKVHRFFVASTRIVVLPRWRAIVAQDIINSELAGLGTLSVTCIHNMIQLNSADIESMLSFSLLHSNKKLVCFKCRAKIVFCIEDTEMLGSELNFLFHHLGKWWPMLQSKGILRKCKKNHYKSPSAGTNTIKQCFSRRSLTLVRIHPLKVITNLRKC